MFSFQAVIFGFIILLLQPAQGCNNGSGRPEIGDDRRSNDAQAPQDTDLESDKQADSSDGRLQLGGIPEGRTDLTEFLVEIISQDFTEFIYKYGPAESVRCSEDQGYSEPVSLSQGLSVNTSDFEDGFMKLCVLGLKASSRQPLSLAQQAVWVRESKPAEQEVISEAIIRLDPDESDPDMLSASPYVVECNQEQTLRAVNSNDPRNVVIVNPARDDGSDQVFRIYWINYNGARVLYSDLNPGYQILLHSFETHPWLISDTAGNCKGIYVTIRDDVFVIDLQ